MIDVVLVFSDHFCLVLFFFLELVQCEDDLKNLPPECGVENTSSEVQVWGHSKLNELERSRLISRHRIWWASSSILCLWTLIDSSEWVTPPINWVMIFYLPVSDRNLSFCPPTHVLTGCIWFVIGKDYFIARMTGSRKRHWNEMSVCRTTIRLGSFRIFVWLMVCGVEINLNSRHVKISCVYELN